MNVVAVTAIGWCYCMYIVAAQDKFCSTSCSTVGILQSTPGHSCSGVYQFNKASRGASGNYWINTTTGVHQVYCDMELECGGHKGGWMRIADLDTSRGDDCPSEWTKITTPVVACIATDNTSSSGCYSTYFSTLSIPYRKVCGMTVGYQKDYTDGFAGVHFSSRTINGPYVDSVSITYGTPRRHLWTYAVGFSDKSNQPNFNCPCAKFPGPLPPSFVHDYYYCESGTEVNGRGNYIDDPVWDGEGCSDENACCADPNLPWFYRQIPLTASEDIETRICRDSPSIDEDILIRELQLYIQ